jgi:hypothetical protein
MGSTFDITGDGKRFVAIKLDRGAPPTQLHLVLNPLSATADSSPSGKTTP